jgi:hypothetical protein
MSQAQVQQNHKRQLACASAASLYTRGLGPAASSAAPAVAKGGGAADRKQGVLRDTF